MSGAGSSDFRCTARSLPPSRWNSDGQIHTQVIWAGTAVSAETGQLSGPGSENVEVNSRAGSLTLISMEDKGLPRDGRGLTGAIHGEDELDLETTQQDSGGLAGSPTSPPLAQRSSRPHLPAPPPHFEPSRSPHPHREEVSAQPLQANLLLSKFGSQQLSSQ